MKRMETLEQKLHAALIDLASDDAERQNRAVEAITPYVRRIARNYSSIELDDGVQLILIRLLTAAPSYDAARPATPFVATIARRTLTSEAERLRCHKSLTLTTALSIHFEYTDELSMAQIIPDDQPPHDQAVADHEARQSLYARLQMIVTRREAVGLLGYLQSRKQAATAAHYGMSVKSLDNALTRGKKVLRELLRRHPEISIDGDHIDDAIVAVLDLLSLAENQGRVDEASINNP